MCKDAKREKKKLFIIGGIEIFYFFWGGGLKIYADGFKKHSGGGSPE